MAVSFPSNADSAQLATDGYSEVILLSSGGSTTTTSATTDFLLIGGGGGAGGRHAGGGGAGGYKTSWAGSGSELSGGTPGTLKTALTLNAGTDYFVTVGRGGRYGFDGHRGVSGVTKGNDTSISGSDITTVSVDGGGFGAGGNDEQSTATDAQGGSSGGASATLSATAHSLTDEGHAGGASGSTGNPFVGGGGGGAGGAGQTGYQNARGGASRTSSITGASVARAGGGGGGQFLSGYSWVGTNGGGGAGNGTIASGNGTYAGDALAHTGSGGGGGGGDYSAGGNGASGITVFRIPSTVTYSASQLASDVSSTSNCTATYSAAADGSGDHVITFTIADATGGNISSGSGTSATNRGSSDGTATWTPTISTTTTTSPTTFTIPAGVDSVSMVAIGPGGGSGGSNGSNAGGGGGGGGLSWINSVAVSEGSTITLTGGVGGIGGDSGGADGDSGTASTVSLSYLGPISYSGVDINPFNDVLLTGDSATGILTARSNRGTDSDVISALGQLDSITIGSGRLTVFGVFTNSIGTALQSTITNSPYIDSNGNSTVGATDPNDVRGYGPGGDELKQVIIRSRAGDTITPV